MVFMICDNCEVGFSYQVLEFVEYYATTTNLNAQQLEFSSMNNLKRWIPNAKKVSALLFT